MVKIWNGYIPMADQMAPKRETAEQRKQREEKSYRHKRMKPEETRLMDSYDPKKANGYFWLDILAVYCREDGVLILCGLQSLWLHSIYTRCYQV